MSSGAHSDGKSTSVKKSLLVEEETAPAIEILPEMGAPAPFSGKFADLPYDIKYMIWHLVVRLRRVVEVEASIERIGDPSVKGGPPKLRLNLHQFCKLAKIPPK